MNDTDPDLEQIGHKERRQLLKDEYILLQNQYEDFDRRSLTIKGWLGSGSIAALALSFNAESQYSYVIPVFVAVISMVFWYLEACWKCFQYALRPRIVLIETYFRGQYSSLETSQEPAPLQIFSAWFDSYLGRQPNLKGRLSLWQAGMQAFVCQPYLTIIVLSAISLLLVVMSSEA